MRVDEDGFCFLDVSARIVQKHSSATLTVLRDATGYHVTEHVRPTLHRLYLRKSGLLALPFAKYYPVEPFQDEVEKTAK